MTKREIMDLVQHNQETKTYYVHYEGYGFQISQTYIWPLSLMAHTTTVWVTVLVTLNRYYAVCRLMGPLRSYVLKATKLQVSLESRIWTLKYYNNEYSGSDIIVKQLE